jgi:hypothetical protein
MPHRRVPRHLSLVGRLGAALTIVGLLALSPLVASNGHAQGRPEPGMGRPGAGARAGGGGGLVVPGQTQNCQEYPGAWSDFEAFYGLYAAPSWDPWGFPVYANYNVPPFGGYWGFYTGVGGICTWRPH